MSEKQYASHNVSVLICHSVLPTKYRRVVVDKHVDEIIAETCVEISKRYPIYFLKVGNGQGSYASVGAKCTENESNRNCENGQKYHRGRSLLRVSRSKEEVVGRSAFVGWILCWDGGSAWKWKNNSQLCEKPGGRI